MRCGASGLAKGCNYSSECYVLLLLDVGVVYQWDSARLLTDPSQEVTAAVVRGSRSESI